MTLTDNDIRDLWDPAEIPWDEVDPVRYARVVEAKVLTKLREQEPAYFEVRCDAAPRWMRVDASQYAEYTSQGWEGRKLYADPLPAVVQVPQGWRFVRRADGIGIYAPPPKLGESPRTSDTVPASNRDLYDLLGKLADQQATAPQPAVPVPWREAVKVAQEALKTCERFSVSKWEVVDMTPKIVRAALAQLDRLEGGK